MCAPNKSGICAEGLALILSCVSLVVQFCELLLDPMNGAVNTTDTLEGTVAGYSCMQGYILSGDETRVCQRNTNTLLGVWSGTEPTCMSRF